MEVTIQKDGYRVLYQDTPEIREKVFARVMQYFKEHDTYTGEGIHQTDNCIIDAPNVMSDIADDILECRHEEDD